MQAIRMLLGHVRPHLWALPVLVVLGLMASAAEAVGIGILIPLLDVLMAQGPGQALSSSGWLVDLTRQYGADFGAETRVALLVGTVFGLVVLKSIVIFSYSSLAIWFNGRVVHELRCALTRQMLQVGYAFLMRTDHGRLVNAFDHQIWQTSEVLDRYSQLVIHACNVVVLGMLLLLISWQMTIAVALGVFMVSLLNRAMSRLGQRMGGVMVAAQTELSERILEMMRSMRVVRLFGREDHEQERFDRSSNRERRASLRVELIGALIQPLTEVLHVLLLIGIFVAWHGDVGLSILLPFLLLLYRVQPHARSIDHQRVRIASLLPAVVEVTTLLDTSDKPYVCSGTRPYHGLRATVAFRHVRYAYEEPAKRYALDDVTCSFTKNQLTAIVGGSGAGKSTLISLLCRLYDPVGGRILVDDVPLPELDLADWRRHLAFAGQDAELLGESVLENIAYGRPDATRDEVIEAARRADAHDFIVNLPHGYDTHVGERGSRLSAGQRQRIGLARALLPEPEILILDEATNALDSLSEQAIQNALARLAGKLTMVVIAHRLSTVRLADHVIVLNEGRPIEQGHPDHLLQNDSHFSRLWQLQLGALEAAARV